MTRVLPRFPTRLLINPAFAAPADGPAGPGDASAAAARAEIASWPGYAATPLVSLAGLAAALGIAALHYKDEATRFGLGSFKALGGAYAVLRVVQRAVAAATGETPAGAALRAGRHRDIAGAITVTTATDGNHGRSVAWGARMFGCRAVIYVPAACSAGREAAIAACGADVVRTDRGYDGTVRRCAADAAAEGRAMVSDTSWEGYMDVPRDVTDGYTVMAAEALARLPDRRPPSHVFVQGGVGALAAAVCGHFRARLGPAAPRLTVVEPEGAACLLASARAGRAASLPGAVHSEMAGLSCGTASPLAWRVLATGAFAFLTVPDEVTAPAMRLLADGRFGDPPIVAGESAIAGLAGLIGVARDKRARERLGLGPGSRVLLFGTEGATDPAIYETLVGRPAEAVKPADH